MIRCIAVLGLVLCMAWAQCPTAFAAEAVPQLLNYQGKLADSLGKPVDGSKQMIFEFHDAAVDGNLLGGFSETQQVVVTKGVFNVLIGSATTGGVPALVFDQPSVYLGVSVEGEPLSPRQHISSVAYAFRSAQADNATHADDAGSLNGVPASDIQAQLANLQARVSELEQNACRFAPLCFVPACKFNTSTGTTVFLSAYYIDKYEVTNELYCRFLNAGGNDDHYQSGMSAEIGRTGTAAPYTYQPVTGFEKKPTGWVTWFDATDFCAWRSTAESLPAGSYRLPTEAEWEKAAGWGDPARTSLWTYAYQDDTIDCSKANYGSCVGTTRDVGSYGGKTSYGCYDMSGNILEWCSDWYALGQYPTSTTNPTGPPTGGWRILRGGSWGYDSAPCRVDWRSYSPPSRVDGVYGFRCARTAK